ncbi:class V lanthionine synthetase subunit LxmK [Allokutzneria sp. NRRL B-24872]|uniref:class V lanthionine synthetase subunit LxmK n=1 Tax=Allokutzneria sp. NRRL B-24872 TaxID=1137961 RepID=UPI00143DB111|nr:class V lanthionine synthetase subunit LxmK [Allokutzneria sp. NRRL B-24872]
MNRVIGEPASRDLLERLGLGRALESGAASFSGRNDNWAGATTSGTEVFLKRTSATGMRRAVAFEVFAAARTPEHLRAPRCVGWDEDAGLHVTELLSERDRVSGDQLADSGDFGADVAEAVGRAIGELHGWTPTTEVPAHEEIPILGPIARLFGGLPLAVYLEATGAELEVWRLVRHDRPLRAALDALAGQSAVALRPVHGDLRLDQLQVVGSTVHVTDWEEFGLADPAVDVGAFVGQWVQRAVLGITEPERDEAENSLSYNDIIQRTITGLREVKPIISAFWAGYRAERAEIEVGLAERATAFAGWHMFDRMFAVAHQSSQVLAVQRAAAGIGRKLLLDPGRYVDVVGLGAS